MFPVLLPYTLISLPPNCWVMWLMISSPVFWTDRMEAFEFHLVITELLIGFLELPTLSMSFHSDAEMIESILIKFINVIFTTRILFQSSICIERYLAVVHPVLYLRYKPLRYRMTFSCVIWLDTIVTAIYQMLLCDSDPRLVALQIITFATVLIINAFCCISVLRALKQPSPGEGERGVSNEVKKRAFSIVLSILVTTFFMYVPLVTMLLLVGKIDLDVLCLAQPLAFCLMIWLGAIYPLLYLHRARKHLTRDDVCVNCF
ncbi:hypothetical protein GBF38_002801 [Nibea albiflora]|uniref:Uncharacterized protein n=1 Tax=Nibea albiflora TaxID=240163 RepID=A0ACB7FJH7_NIBAL|nr:hypothetical protein GBF38_002801 [Nibea albiflora]